MSNPFDQFDTPQASSNPFDQFDAPKQPQQSALEQLGEATGAVYRGLTNRGVGLIQTVDSLPLVGGFLSGAAKEAARRQVQANNAESNAQGIGSKIVEVASDPVNWFNPSGGLVAAGAKAGAASAFTEGNTGDKSISDRAMDAVKGGAIGAATGKVLGVTGNKLAGAVEDIANLNPAVVQTAKDLRAAASPLFDKFRASGGTYTDKLTNELADIADSAKVQGIAGSDLKPADQAFNDALDYYAKLRGKTLSPDDLQRLDQSIADDVSRFNRAGEYNYGRILNDIKYNLRERAFNPEKAADYVTGASPEAVNDLVQANNLWSQAYKAADIEKILQKAAGTENPATSIRTGIKNLLANDKKMAGYTDQEKQLLQEAMDRGSVGGLIHLFGGRLTDSLAGGAAGFAAGGAPGSVAGAIVGKAVGGKMAGAAGSVQANRLKGALEAMQTGVAPSERAGKALKQALPDSLINEMSTIVPTAATMTAGGAGALAAQPGTTPVQQPMPQPVPTVQPVTPEPQAAAQPQLIHRIAQAESGGDPTAQSRTSTASGILQFTDPTWQSSVMKWGKELGIDLKDKNDPQAQMALGQKLMEANAEQLTKALRREPSDVDQYAAWFLGPTAAAKLALSQGSGRDAVTLFPRKVVSANRSMFFDGQRPRKVEELYSLLQSKIDGQRMSSNDAGAGALYPGKIINGYVYRGGDPNSKDSWSL